MSDKYDWDELVDRHLRGELSDTERERLTEQLDSDSSARRDFVLQAQWDTQIAEALRESHGSRREPNVLITKRSTIWFMPALLAIAAVTILALTSSLYFNQTDAQREIAKVTGLSGSLLWTGDGGRVERDLNVGAKLTGGSIEGMTPDSWFELEFNDGSTITISGNSMLTFSEYEQKELHLKAGNLSCNVKPQPSGKPMLVHTRSAMLEVVGTQFEVEAAIASTMLNVNEGKVRVKRLTDGSTVDVPAKHRVIAAHDHSMSPVLVPDSVSHWKSQLPLGPDGTFGKWSPAMDAEDAKLRALPFTLNTRQGKTMTLYTASFGVSRGDNPPVILQPGSQLRVRGHIKSPRRMFFGVTVRHANGEFAGNFQIIRPANVFHGGQDFELTLSFSNFRLDPSLIPIKDKLPTSPDGSVVESFWCHTLNQPSGLEIVEVELIPPHPAPAAQASLSN